MFTHLSARARLKGEVFCTFEKSRDWVSQRRSYDSPSERRCRHG